MTTETRTAVVLRAGRLSLAWDTTTTEDGRLCLHSFSDLSWLETQMIALLIGYSATVEIEREDRIAVYEGFATSLGSGLVDGRETMMLRFEIRQTNEKRPAP